MKTSKRVMVFCLAGSLAACTNMNSTERRTLSAAEIDTDGEALIGGLASGQPLAIGVGAADGAGGSWLYDRHRSSESQ